MSTRIIGEDGSYIVHEEPEAPEGIDPSDLPQQQPDRYAKVETRDFSNAGNMSQAQMVTLAEVAGFRGESDIAMRWKMLATESVLTQQRAADAETMKSMLEPKAMPAPGQILNSVSDLPWHQDAEWQQTRADLDAAQMKLVGMEADDPEYTETGTKVANLVTLLSEREEAAKQAALDSGVMTEMDMMVLNAQAGLAEKAAQMMRSAE